MLALAKAAAKGICPPYLWAAARWLRSEKPPQPRPLRTVSTTEEIDAAIACAVAAYDVSYDAHLEALRSFRLAYPADLPTDPSSPEYRTAQLELYRRISARSGYRAAVDEATPFEAHHAEFPFPYFTKSSVVVGSQLMSLGYLIHALDLPAGGRILEIGSGYGKTTIELAQMGYSVVAVDVYPPFLDLVRRRCRALGRDIQTVCSDMLDYRPAAPFDRVVFSASFHHCSDHVRMVERFGQLVAPGGAVLLSGETIYDDFPAPWGVNPEGAALWAIRRHGWMELGFQTDYFLELLARFGWACEIKSLPWDPNQRLFIARRAAEQKQWLRAAA